MTSHKILRNLSIEGHTDSIGTDAVKGRVRNRRVEIVIENRR